MSERDDYQSGPRKPPETYYEKSSSIFARIWGKLGLFSFTDCEIRSMKKPIRKLLDASFDCDDYDFEKADERFIEGMKKKLVRYGVDDDDIEEIVDEAKEQVNYCFDPLSKLSADIRAYYDRPVYDEDEGFNGNR